MTKYSDFFLTLHDEIEPTGKLGRGTHYSVLRATVFHDQYGKRLKEAFFCDFAVIWDEDHDDRIISAIERIYQVGMLPRFTFFGERKGRISALMNQNIYDKFSQNDLKLYEHILQESTELTLESDFWDPSISTISDEFNGIIGDSDKKVQTYLQNILNIWELGVKRIPNNEQDKSYYEELNEIQL